MLPDIQSHQLCNINDQHPKYSAQSIQMSSWTQKATCPDVVLQGSLVYDATSTVVALLYVSTYVISHLQCVSDTTVYTLIGQVQAS